MYKKSCTNAKFKIQVHNIKPSQILTVAKYKYIIIFIDNHSCICNNLVIIIKLIHL